MRKLKYIGILLLMLVMTSSCNKWLDLKPEDGIIRDNFWQTKEQLQSTVIGCYSSMLSINTIEQIFRWGEMRGDMVGITPFSSIHDVNIYEGNILPSNSITDWAPIYETINYCNTVIEFGPGVLERDATLTQVQLNNNLAEAHAIRGLMYFYLLRAFGEVPLQLKATSSDNRLEQLAKSSKEEVYNQVLSDLKFAEINAATSYGSNPAENQGRITKYAVYAMLADLYLWNDDYENCITYCDKVISSNQFALVQEPDQQSFFNKVIRNERSTSTESIFELQYDSQILNPVFALFTGAAPYGIGPKVPEYFGVDELDPFNVDFRGDGSSYLGATQSIAKSAGIYSGEDFELVESNESTANWIFYRYSDVLLLKAEALTWTERGLEALDLITQVRQRANALEFTEEAPSETDPEAISAYILRERSREFAYEGKRWFDMLRIAKRNNYAQLNLMIEIIAENAPVDRQQSIINKYRDVRSHYFPISQFEIQADKNLVQNPFYQ